ncbi:MULTISPECIES: hypothetical protein [Gordonia]|uniref:SnoaL-like domain-containing protein n=1 Tax=Gordonia alkanivorans NBRC 16433 TaxID=1027371 RepID=F9VRG9_9ACTN|nr:MULTISPECIES: hypothetical protein [Gordonia]MDH3007834.1 nuclear transport factor 2 family protein [Gordonia alkanivorans]MDH3010637.1 nuclear transport factor 2 family protein [Gordonia alkanivorans]MDH3015354.1 nuclear transport factor 2 family protein [Gordonia alkanivorans]MDH3040499.1 nuclear transport factor 2 family protein [Gordonia alkanivorans]MDH3048712.1 nuclear transport factor 2 family protein [Gordonia alkanivorans]
MTNTSIADCPDAVRAFMRLTTCNDRTAATALFTEDAAVTDDGRDHVGIASIRDWLDREASEYTYTTTVVGASSSPTDGAVVTTRLEGDFPGGVVDLDYRFGLDEQGRLRRLVIEPTGT